MTSGREGGAGIAAAPTPAPGTAPAPALAPAAPPMRATSADEPTVCSTVVASSVAGTPYPPNPIPALPSPTAHGHAMASLKSPCQSRIHHTTSSRDPNALRGDDVCRRTPTTPTATFAADVV